jgi:hypothetical protein
MGKSTISMAIFHGYVKLPEGICFIAWYEHNHILSHEYHYHMYNWCSMNNVYTIKQYVTGLLNIGVMEY